MAITIIDVIPNQTIACLSCKKICTNSDKPKDIMVGGYHTNICKVCRDILFRKLEAEFVRGD